MAVIRISVVCGRINRHGTALKRRNSPVRSRCVMRVLVTGCDFRPVIWQESQRRIHARTLHIHAVAEAVGILVHPIESNSELFVQYMVEVSGDSPIAETSNLGGCGAQR